MNITNIEIPAKGYMIQGAVLRGNNSTAAQPVILSIHGWKSQMQGYVDRFAEAVEMGYTVLLFDMRGHGTTGGALNTLSPKDHQDDCQAAFDYISKLEHIDKDNITVYGSSYGGYQTALLSKFRTFQHMILRVPAQYIDSNFSTPDTQRSQETDQYRLIHHSPEDNMALEAINTFEGNILLIESELDEQVPKQVPTDYRNAITTKYTYELMEGADHSLNNPGTEEAMRTIMNSWLQKHI